MKTIVISAVNIRKGGTLTILKDCLQYLSEVASASDEYKIVALVHDKNLSLFPNIHYMELPWSIKSWVHRLWCEYVTMRKISRQLQPIHLWFSLHDTTPNVIAARQAVYCQTSFPFLRWSWKDFRYDYKIPLFALFTKYAYRINIKKNNYLVVQQEWLRKGFSKMFSLPQEKFIVAPPPRNIEERQNTPLPSNCKTFFYASTADSHKNFELLCEATQRLENEVGKDKFTVIITIKGNENKYAQMLYNKWGNVSSLKFAGFMGKEQLYATYNTSDCLIFPSRIETWGLPISEFMAYRKPMLLADLPYAHETSVGSNCTAFFNPTNAIDLKNAMKAVFSGDFSRHKAIQKRESQSLVVGNWEELFDILWL